MYTIIHINMIYKIRQFDYTVASGVFFPATMSENDIANAIVMHSGDFSCRGPSTWEVYMRQGSNPYSLAHSGGPSAEALDFLRTSPPKKNANMIRFFGGEDGDSLVVNSSS